jgi:NAD(P) transhydrogenase
VHTGTIPSKTLRETVLNLSGWRERGFYGRSYRVKQDIGAIDLIARLQKTLDHEVEVLEHQFSRNAVKTACGEARFVGPNQIEIATDTGETRTVIGAGVIGVEYATIFSALDVAVTLIEPRPTFLDFIDKELIDEFMHELRDRNVAVRLGSAVKSIERSESGSIVTRLSDGRNVTSEMLLFAAGRVGATDRLNLEAAGIEVDHRGRIAVNPLTLQTSVPHIYAAGDVIGFPSLASTSMEQGRVAACHALGMEPLAPPEFFPYGIYSVPEISTTGLTEEEVRTRGIPYEVGVARFRETSRGHIMELNSGMMKMIFSTKTRRLLGVHILGDGATELIHIGQAVLNLKGTIDYFIQNTFNYPTLAEAYKIAGLDAWNRMTR